jgi:threonine dehydrogenase-like Zn-dependent dehydrogenase
MDVVIETVGAGASLSDALASVRPRGSVVLVSGHYDTADVDLTRIVWSEAVVTGSNCYGYSGMETDFGAAIDLIATGKVAATKLISHRLPFDDIAEAFRISADKSHGAIKVHVYQE